MQSKKEFPTLYISTEDGKTRFWKIYVKESNSNKATIHSEYGVLGGKVTKAKPKVVNHKGTITSFEKAVTAAAAKHRNRIKRGYSLDKDTKVKKTDIVLPMGSHKIEDHKNKIRYPAIVQRKLDGYRCIANIENKKVNLLTRTGKEYFHLEDIRKEIKKIKEMEKNSGMYLDGELYNHDLLLRNIGSIVRKQYVNNDDKKRMKLIKLYVFDMFDTNNKQLEFKDRYKILEKIFKKHKFKYIQLVKCFPVKKYEDIEKYYEQFISEGYEGVVLKNLDGIYTYNKKSYDVLRTKEFKKGEFKIIGAKEGSGAQKGAVIWKIQCSNKDDKSFWGIPIGTIEERKKLYKNYKKYLGKMAILKFWDVDKDGCIIRNPVVEKILD